MALPIANKAIVRIIFAITMYEYWVFQDERSCNLVNAVAAPLIDTAIAAHKAKAEKR